MPGTYFFTIPYQVICQIPLANMSAIKNDIRYSRIGDGSKNKTSNQNAKKIISKIRKNLNVILKRGNFLLNLLDSSSMEWKNCIPNITMKNVSIIAI